MRGIMTTPNMGEAHHQPREEARPRRQCVSRTPAPEDIVFITLFLLVILILRGEAASVLQGAKVAAEAKACGRSVPRSGTTKQNGGGPALILPAFVPEA